MKQSADQPKAEEKVISDARTIAGLLREALFQGRRIQFCVNELAYEAEILQIEEESSRDKSAPKFLLLNAPAHKSSPQHGPTAVRFSCFFMNFIASWTAPVESLGNGQFKTVFPAELLVSNNRKGIRLAISRSGTFGSPVLVVTDSLHAEGHFQLDDYSAGGLGGTLRVLSEMPIRIGTQIRGVAQTAGGSVTIDAEVAQVQLQVQAVAEAVNDSVEASFQVGLRHRQIVETEREEPGQTVDERRGNPRVQLEISLQLSSPFNPQHRVSLTLENASCTGFLARLRDPSDAVLFPMGCMASILDYSLMAKVIRLNEDYLHFQIAGGTDSDRVRWLKLLAPFQNPSTSTSTPTGLDIIDLFCDSGAAASEYLKNQRRFAHSFVEGLSSHEVHGNWIHRWIERTSHGQIRGHVSAVRTSDHAWYIGDIAGMTAKEQKITSQFIPRFLGYLRDYAVSATPCPAFLLSWMEGHPYWQEFETTLKTTERHQVLGFSRTRYHRVAMSPKATRKAGSPDFEKSSVEFKWVTASDYVTILEIRRKLEAQSQLFLADCFDFSIPCFGSPTLRSQILASKQNFLRSYAVLTVGDAKFLVIFQNFPLGTSPLRTGDVPWVIPFGNSTTAQGPNQSHYQLGLDRIRLEGLRAGFSFPGIMEVVGDGEDAAVRGTSGAKLMLWTLTHPDGMEFLYRSRNS